MVLLPDSAHTRLPSIGGAQRTLHFIARTKPGLVFPCDLVILSMFAQRPSEKIPLFRAKTKGTEESSLACSVAVGRVEEISHDLLTFHECLFCVRKLHALTLPRLRSAIKAGRPSRPGSKSNRARSRLRARFRIALYGRTYNPAFLRRASARSVSSHRNPWSSRPKWP